jgi:hypothetical protein
LVPRSGSGVIEKYVSIFTLEPRVRAYNKVHSESL